MRKIIWLLTILMVLTYFAADMYRAKLDMESSVVRINVDGLSPRAKAYAKTIEGLQVTSDTDEDVVIIKANGNLTDKDVRRVINGALELN